MQEKIQNVLVRNSFMGQVLCTGAVIIIANTVFMFHEQMGKKYYIGTFNIFEPLKENLVLTASAWFCTRLVGIPSLIFPDRRTV